MRVTEFFSFGFSSLLRLAVDGIDDFMDVLVSCRAGLVGILVLLGDIADGPADAAAVEGDGFAGGHILQLDIGPQGQRILAVLQTEAHQDVGILDHPVRSAENRVSLALFVGEVVAFAVFQGGGPDSPHDHGAVFFQGVAPQAPGTSQGRSRILADAGDHADALGAGKADGAAGVVQKIRKLGDFLGLRAAFLTGNTEHLHTYGIVAGARRRAVLKGVDGQQIAGFRQIDITRTVHFLNGIFLPIDGHGGLAVKFRFVRHIQVVGRYLDGEGNCTGSAVVFPVDHRECVFARLHRDLQKLRLQRQGKRFVYRTADCQETGSRRDVHFAVQEDFGKFPGLAVDGETQGVPAALVPGLAVALGNRPGVQLGFQPNQLVKFRAVHQGTVGLSSAYIISMQKVSTVVRDVSLSCSFSNIF